MNVNDIIELGIASFPAIMCMCFVIGLLCKASKLDNEWIPVVMALSGAALGVVAMFIVPEFPAQDFISAAAVGAVSGLAATGLNQVYVQAGKLAIRKQEEESIK